MRNRSNQGSLSSMFRFQNQHKHSVKENGEAWILGRHANL
jgi:hypothetical protein